MSIHPGHGCDVGGCSVRGLVVWLSPVVLVTLFFLFGSLALDFSKLLLQVIRLCPIFHSACLFWALPVHSLLNLGFIDQDAFILLRCHRTGVYAHFRCCNWF